MLVIGLSALSFSGKDSFFNVFKKLLPDYDVRRYALADALKEDLKEFLLSKCGIDPTNCSIEDKRKIRPLLVSYGKIKREQTEGRYWTNLVEQQILNDKPEIILATDIRYDEYPQDELWWLKEHMKGFLIHISRFDYIPNNTNAPLIKDFYKAPNIEEANNDPKIKAAANYRIEWESAPKDKDLNEWLSPHVQGVIQELKYSGWLEKQT